jgi:hypothetical protein
VDLYKENGCKNATKTHSDLVSHSRDILLPEANFCLEDQRHVDEGLDTEASCEVLQLRLSMLF